MSLLFLEDMRMNIPHPLLRIRTTVLILNVVYCEDHSTVAVPQQFARQEARWSTTGNIYAFGRHCRHVLVSVRLVFLLADQ
ncbi:hypothetical protein ANO14919_066080 [Xylariales sp. No.14919]|nr:hypothetical protein ANO14919_066080 [Xylariales sp. No.14919]